MKNTMKRLGLIFTTMIMVVLFAVSVSALESTGQCGENVYWEFDEATGELVITGNGDVWDYIYLLIDSPFAYNQNIKSVELGEHISNIGEYVFTGCNNIEKFIVNKNNLYYSTDDYGVLFNKNKTELIYYPRKSLVSCYEIPKGVQTIKSEAFNNCDNLFSVIFPFGVKIIENSAFEGCDGIEKIIFPETLRFIEDNSFKNCHKLKYIYISCDLQSIGYEAFDNVFYDFKTYYEGSINEWEKIVIDEFNDFGNIVFNCFFMDGLLYTLDSDNKVNIVKYLGDEKVVEISSKINQYYVKSIGEKSFEDCVTIEEILISEGIKKVSAYAFADCDNLKNISMPNSIDLIGEYAFKGCRNLYRITLPYMLNVISEGTFMYCGIKSITIPNSVTRIEKNAFCFSGIENVNWGNSITYIGEGAFANTHLKYIELPMGLTEIGSGAFSNCESLGSAYVPNSVTVFGSRPFGYRSWVDHNGGNIERIELFNTMYGHIGSVAETYAKENDITFVANEDETKQPENPYDDCACNCHKDGIVGFLFKFINFFQKLFGQNKVCACGIAHY